MSTLLEKKNIAVILIAGITLFFFIPVLSSGVINLDDTTTILNHNNPDTRFSVKGAFFQNRVGRYYRPLVALSFLADSKIWALKISGFHLTNIIFHLFNALIFYFIALAFFKNKYHYKITAFILSIGFALNPLTIESVAWISGRSDIMSTFFCLTAFLFYIYKIKFKSVFVSVFFLLGLLVKENAGCILLIIVLFEFITSYPSKGFKESLISALKWLAVLTIPLFAYFYLRFSGFSLLMNQSEIQTIAIHGLHTPGNVSIWSQMISDFLTLPAVIAFYLKKLIFPFPLNFAISQINLPVYSIAFASIFVAIVILIRKKQYFFPLWIVFLCVSFLPSLPVAISDVAWTRFAERYLYLSLPIFCLFAGEIYYRNMLKYPERTRIVNIIIVIVFIVFSIGSIQRIHVWRDKESLWYDTYKKNPLNGKVLYQYGTIIGAKKGLPFFEKAVDFARDNEWKDFSLLMIAQNEANNFNYNAAYESIHKALNINPRRPVCYRAAEILKQILEKKPVEEEKYNQLLIQCYKLAYEKRPEPYDLVNLIKIFETLDDEKNIEKYTTILVKKFPESKDAKLISSKNNK